ARCTFSSLDECAEGAYHVLASDIPVIRMELVDSASIKQVNEYGDYSFPVKHSLFFEFAGAKAATEAQATLAKELMEDLNCEYWEATSDSKVRNEIWKADRKSTRLNSSHVSISYAVFCLKKKREKT